MMSYEQVPITMAAVAFGEPWKWRITDESVGDQEHLFNSTACLSIWIARDVLARLLFLC